MLGRFFARTDQKEAPSQRGETKQAWTDGTVEIDGVTYPLVNWSRSGFLAKDYTGDRKSRDKVEVATSVALGGGRFEFTCTAMLVRVDPASRKVVGSYVDMDTSIRVEMARRLVV